MATEDEILRAYEAELEPEPVRRNRGFWLVVGTILAAAIFLVVEILAHRPLADAIAHAQATLRRATAAAEAIDMRTGGFADADAAGLAAAIPDLSFGSGTEASSGLDDVSVAASSERWAAAVEGQPGACFYLRIGSDRERRYGSGTVCTGEAAMSADQPSW